MAYSYTTAKDSANNDNIQFRAGYEVVSQGIVSGTPQSVINVVLQTRRRSTGTATYKENTSTTFAVDSNSTSKTIDFDVRNYTKDAWYNIRSRSGLTVTHGSDGTKTITISYTVNLAGTSAGNSSGSWSVALPDIAMGSTLLPLPVATATITNATGPTMSVQINKYNSAYCHRLIWKLGSTTIATQNLGTSATNPETASQTLTASSWLPYMTDTATAAASVTLQTFSSNSYTTQIGVDSTKTFTVVCGRTPTIGSITAATVGGVNSVWIGGRTQAKITASSVAGINGSTITQYEFLQNGVVQATYSSTANTYNWTTPNALVAGSYTFGVRVTDTRGKQGTATIAVTVNQYAAPSITGVSVFRCNSGGTAAEQGDRISVKATATATPAGNTATLKVYTKLASDPDTAFTDKGSLTSGTASILSTYAYTSSWTVKIVATDALGTVSTYTTTVPTASYTMDFKFGGTGVAFGKVAETDNLLDSAWPIKAPDITITSFGLPKITKVYAPSTTTQTFTLTAEHAYFLVITKVNATSTAYQGLFLVQCYGTYSAAREIASTTAATVSVSALTLTVTTTQTFVAIKLIDLGGTS